MASTHRHRFLHMIWLGVPEFFTVLSPSDQMRLHDYYRPSEELTDDQLEAHFAEMAQTRLKLRAPAGRAFRRLEDIYLLARDQAAGDPDRWRTIMLAHTHGSYGPANKRGLKIKATGLVRPEIDSRAMARAIVRSVQEDLERERISTPSANKARRTVSGEQPSSSATTRKDRPAA